MVYVCAFVPYLQVLGVRCISAARTSRAAGGPCTKLARTCATHIIVVVDHYHDLYLRHAIVESYHLD